MNLLLKEQVQTSTETNPKIFELKTKIFALKQFGNFSEINDGNQLQDYVEKCLSIERPKKSPKVFIYGDKDNFNSIVSQIKRWNISLNGLVLPKVISIKPGNEALRDTFFYDSEIGYFPPSDYFVLINLNQEVIQEIESRSNQKNSQTVRFDDKSKVKSAPDATDPFDLGKVNPNSIEQVLVGDKIMYPYKDKDGNIIIELVKITY
jgi:hypothetical protein